jgi:dTDP-4-amino-4,6-dideoxygalactose transaminase
MAAGIKQGDEVITVSHTFVATVEVIKLLGAKPVFVDITNDHNMNVDLVEQAITAKTKAILPVHLNGKICYGMDKLMKISKKHSIPIIEDAAQSLGARYKNRGAGTFGLAGCFSFYPAKLLGAFGDAGAIITNDKKFIENVFRLRNHGRGHGLDIERWGFNCRMDNLHAAILDYKLKKLPGWIRRRRQIADIYHNFLSDVKKIELPVFSEQCTDFYDVFQNYEILAQDRDGLVKNLEKHGIQVNLPWGGKAVHQFKVLGLNKSILPRTDELLKKVLMLPIYPELKYSQIEYVARKIKDFYGV